jgi:preprotein translocase subunit SecG
MYQIIITIHVLLGLGIIGLILIQQGKGADAGASFGSGASGSVFGSQGAGSFLTRTTATLATLFFITSLGLAVLNGRQGAAYDLMSPDAVKKDGVAIPLTDNSKANEGLPVVPEGQSLITPPTPPVSATQQPAEEIKINQQIIDQIKPEAETSVTKTDENPKTEEPNKAESDNVEIKPLQETAPLETQGLKEVVAPKPEVLAAPVKPVENIKPNEAKKAPVSKPKKTTDTAKKTMAKENKKTTATHKKEAEKKQ